MGTEISLQAEDDGAGLAGSTISDTAWKPDMCKFDLTRLPVEIRLLIWDFALHHETRDRYAIVDSDGRLDLSQPGSIRFASANINPHRFRIFPTINLRSYILSANRESRACALAFFTVRLDVILRPTSDRLHGYVPRHSESGRKGCIYLNPELDPFLFLKDIAPMLGSHRCFFKCISTESDDSLWQVALKYKTQAPIGVNLLFGAALPSNWNGDNVIRLGTVLHYGATVPDGNVKEWHRGGDGRLKVVGSGAGKLEWTKDRFILSDLTNPDQSLLVRERWLK